MRLGDLDELIRKGTSTFDESIPIADFIDLVDSMPTIVPTEVEEHRVASMEMEIQFERAFHKWLDGKGFSHEDYTKLCVEFAKECAAQMFDEIDPKYANEIRNGLFDPDENEVLS